MSKLSTRPRKCHCQYRGCGIPAAQSQDRSQTYGMVGDSAARMLHLLFCAWDLQTVRCDGFPNPAQLGYGFPNPWGSQGLRCVKPRLMRLSGIFFRIENSDAQLGAYQNKLLRLVGGGGAKRRRGLRRGLTSTKTYFMCVSVGVKPLRPVGPAPLQGGAVPSRWFCYTLFILLHPRRGRAEIRIMSPCRGTLSLLRTLGRLRNYSKWFLKIRRDGLRAVPLCLWWLRWQVFLLS